MELLCPPEGRQINYYSLECVEHKWQIRLRTRGFIYYFQDKKKYLKKEGNSDICYNIDEP